MELFRPSDPIDLSVVIPVYNESANVGPLLARLLPVLERITPAFEVVFVDDGSRDDTAAVIAAHHGVEPRIGAVSFSRNFGKEVALAAGLDHARGRAVVIMDADLQHPPELIETFVARWREGNVMVYAQRRDRDGESRLRRGFARLFYELFARFGEMPLPEGAGDFRLIDRKGVEVLRALPERARFSKGLYSWIGFRSVGVPYTVEARHHGETKWSFRKLFRFAFDGITSFSTVPLRVWTYLGGAIAALAFAAALYFVAEYMLRGPVVPGYASLIVSVMFFSGIQLMSLGIIGEYIGRIFAEVKRRPLYVVAERIGPAAAGQDAATRDDRRAPARRPEAGLADATLPKAV
ncbi:MAG: glycosyltransferase family 2 protein [Methylobacterium sp.]|uniref:glycosyltransferase family 2 protein n=1 Tax=Methylobacterium sp. TaxID=409 RepID=UPI00258841D8|nr:glycosyltransferase family 2 protein [Methylobacterium sp.]MBY0296758.1 glycosyltransferase family 2 protein [Methylobacterium sp.]